MSYNVCQKNMVANVIKAVWLVLLCNSFLFSSTYHVSPQGLDGNNGTSPSAAWKTLGPVNAKSFQPGDIVLFERGGRWEEDLSLRSDGKAGQVITFSAFGTGERPIIRGITAYGDYNVFENLIVDRNKGQDRAVKVRNGHNCIFRKMELCNGGFDGFWIIDGDGLLIDSCHVHHFLKGSFADQQDAHGIVADDTQGLTVSNTEVHHVTGDCFQTDPDRDRDTPQDILLENCYFWTGPLEEDFNLWKKGQNPGENAIDTKMVKSNVQDATRMRITIRNIKAHGFSNSGYIANRAAFNMKEKIEADFDGVTVYDCEIAFRLRGTRGNANNTIKNCVVYNCEKAIRAEDNLSNLKVYNSTFGEKISTQIQFAGGSGGKDTWELLNNAFVGKKPQEADHMSNKIASPAGFVDSRAGDYQLTTGSSLIDAGIPLTAVNQDRLGAGRPYGKGYDVGAYEFGSKPTGLKRPMMNSALKAYHFQESKHGDIYDVFGRRFKNGGIVSNIRIRVFPILVRKYMLF